MTKNGKRVDAELRDYGQWGVECQFFYNGELAYGRRWGTRVDALADAEAKRRKLEGDGWVAVTT